MTKDTKYQLGTFFLFLPWMLIGLAGVACLIYALGWVGVAVIGVFAACLGSLALGFCLQE